jgi:itaconyl-CoA hydratase
MRKGLAMAQQSDRLVPGWNGRYFEDFTEGDVYRHPLGRTITTTDNAWLTLLTQNTAPLHFDAHYAAQTSWGRPLVDSTLTLALVTGQSVTIYSQSTVVSARPSKSHPEAGIVKVRTIGYNQRGTVVITFIRTLLVYRRGHGPAAVPAPDEAAQS